MEPRRAPSPDVVLRKRTEALHPKDGDEEEEEEVGEEQVIVDDDLSYEWMEKYLKEVEDEIEEFIDENRSHSDLSDSKRASIESNPTLDQLEDHLGCLLTQLDNELSELNESAAVSLSHPLSDDIDFGGPRNLIHDEFETSSGDSLGSSCSSKGSTVPLNEASILETTADYATPASSPTFQPISPSIETDSFKSMDSSNSFTHYNGNGNGNGSPFSASDHSHAMETAGSSSPDCPLNQLVSSHFPRVSFYENNDEVPFELLSASQIQKIIDYVQPHKWLPNGHSGQSRYQSSPSHSSHDLFGCQIESIPKLTGGLSLPTFMENALVYLVRFGLNSVGIFRKSGVKSRITALRQKLEELNGSSRGHNNDPGFSFNPSSNRSDEEYCVYDIADLVKTWLREVQPKPLITREVVTVFRERKHNETNSEFALKLGALMVSDSQRALVQIVLHFLSWFSSNSSVNQMNAHNLSICLAPSLCEVDAVNGSQASPFGQSADPYLAETELLFDAQKCLEFMIDNCESLFIVSVNSAPFIGHNNGNTAENHQNSAILGSGLVALINGGNLLPQTHETAVTINASPIDILRRILYQRNLFDPTIVEWKIIEEDPNTNSDVFTYKTQTSAFLPTKSVTLERKWNFCQELSPASSHSSLRRRIKGSKPKSSTTQSITLLESGHLYDATWRIRVEGQGKSLLHHSIAVDLRGHSYHWYTRTFPAIHEWQLYQIKQSFLVDFVETKHSKASEV